MDTSPLTSVNNSRRLVLGHGPANADIMIVGEAPGQQETYQGRPFVGPAGGLLDECLNTAGISREECYITNVVKEQPPKNNIKPFLDVSKKVPLESEAYGTYLNALREEILRVNPSVVVAAGGTALWALCGKKGITNWRGSVLESTLIPGLKVIPIIHPAAALRQYIQKYYIIFDLRKAKQHRTRPGFFPDDREYVIDPTMPDTMDFLDEVHGAGLHGAPIGFDIEVASREVSCISFAYVNAEGVTRAISVPTDSGPRAYTPEQEAIVWRKITEILEDEAVTKIAHNASFDVTFLFRRYGIRTRNLHDTMVACNIIYPDFNKSLAFVTSVFTDMPYYKDEGKAGIEAGIKNVKMAGSQYNFWLYNAKDSVVLVEALPRLLKELTTTGNMATYDNQRALIEPFLFMTELGVGMDRPGMKAASNSVGAEVAEMEARLHALVGYALNPRSFKQLIDYFYTLHKITPYKDRATGGVTVDTNALKRISRGTKEEPAYAAKLIMMIRAKGKMKGTYYDMNLDDDGRLRCSINIVGTKYGRVSSSKTIFRTGMNMQNQPRSMKRYMHPDPGFVAYEMDLSQAENRVVAYISGDANMIEAFESGRDIHKQTAGLIFSKPYDEISKAAGSSALAGGLFSERDWGKKANHGLNYGMRESKAGFLWEVPTAEAKFVVDRYHQAYPMVREWHASIERQLRKNRMLTNLYGRRVTFWDRFDNNLLMAAYSFVPQSTVADHLNRYGVRRLYERQDLFPEAQLMMQVHDSIVFQIPLAVGWERQAEILQGIRDSLQRPLAAANGQMFSIPSDIKILPINFLDGGELDRDSEDPLHIQLEEAYDSILSTHS